MPKLPEGLSFTAHVAFDRSRTGIDACYYVDAAALVECCQALVAGDWHNEDVVVVDAAEGYEGNYHFARFDGPERIVLKVLAPRDNPVFPSIAAVYPGSEWHEREQTDFFAVRYTDIPNDRPLLLSEDMIGLAPLAKAEAARAGLCALLPEFTVVEAPDEHPTRACLAARAEEKAKAAAAAKAKAAAAAKAKADAAAKAQAEKTAAQGA